MDSAEVSAQIAHVDHMLDRVDKVIARERPLRADTSYPRRPKPKRPPKVKPAVNFVPAPQRPAVASGELTGNEMRVSGYSPRSHDRDDCDPDGMWAAFESDFDDMVKGMH